MSIGIQWWDQTAIMRKLFAYAWSSPSNGNALLLYPSPLLGTDSRPASKCKCTLLLFCATCNGLGCGCRTMLSTLAMPQLWARHVNWHPMRGPNPPWQGNCLHMLHHHPHEMEMHCCCIHVPCQGLIADLLLNANDRFEPSWDHCDSWFCPHFWPCPSQRIYNHWFENWDLLFPWIRCIFTCIWGYPIK